MYFVFAREKRKDEPTTIAYALLLSEPQTPLNYHFWRINLVPGWVSESRATSDKWINSYADHHYKMMEGDEQARPGLRRMNQPQSPLASRDGSCQPSRGRSFVRHGFLNDLLRGFINGSIFSTNKYPVSKASPLYTKVEERCSSLSHAYCRKKRKEEWVYALSVSERCIWSQIWCQMSLVLQQKLMHLLSSFINNTTWTSFHYLPR